MAKRSKNIYGYVEYSKTIKKNVIICRVKVMLFIYRVRKIYGNAHFDLALDKKEEIENLSQQLISR